MKYFLFILLILLELYICFSNTSMEAVKKSESVKLVSIHLRFSFKKFFIFLLLNGYLCTRIFI